MNIIYLFIILFVKWIKKLTHNKYKYYKKKNG